MEYAVSAEKYTDNAAEAAATIKLFNNPLNTGRFASLIRFLKFLTKAEPGSAENPLPISECALVELIINM